MFRNSVPRFPRSSVYVFLRDNTKAELEAKHGKVWTTSEMQEEFDALGFMAPFIIVSKRDTGERGSLMFTHSPRYYFSWKPE